MNVIYKSPERARSIQEHYRALLQHWPVANHQRMLPTCEGETFVVTCGAEDGPDVVLLHGAMANTATWMREVPAWAPDVRLHAVDLIGEPGRSAPSRPALASHAHARWLDDVLDGLVVTRAVVVGLSLGGWIAVDYAIRRPQRVSSLVLMSPGGIGRQRNVLMWAVPLALLGSWGIRRSQHLVAGDLAIGASPAAQDFETMTTLIWKHFRPRHDRLPLFSDDALGGLRMPVQVVIGGRDVMFDAHDLRRRVEAHVPRAEIRFLPAGRHYPGDQSREILAFLRRTAQVT